MEKIIYDESNGLWEITPIMIPMHPARQGGVHLQ